jgi:fatty acid desaturase 2 (delta-6 desaturase)
VADFQELHRTLKAMNMFSANMGFFFIHLAQILILEVLAWLILLHFGNGWTVTIFISFLLTVSQVSKYPKPRQ